MKDKYKPDSFIIWQGTYHHPDQGAICIWGPTLRIVRAGIRKDIRAMKRDYPEDDGGPINVVQWKIPATRDEIIAWLNRHFTRDNG